MVRLDLSFLNTFAADLDGQPITRFRAANNQGLLVYLALNSDQAQPRDVLATLFWPEETEKNARHNLRQALYQLRTLLGDAKSRGEPFLKVNRQTAQLNGQSDYVLDVHQFLAAIDGNDLETAVALYHGDLLPGFTCDSVQFEEWLRQERESMHQLALEAMSELTQEHLTAGRLSKAQAIARQQLSLERWRERAFRQLMRAYALAGDRSKALAEFAICREILWEELGIEPDPETVSLYEEIEAGRFSALRSDEPVRPPLKVRHNLPANLTPLIGRQTELAQIGGLLSENGVRLLTITGPGGMGKTRLALAAGASLLANFVDGVYFVDLTPLAEPAEILMAIAAILEYQVPDKSREMKPQLLDMLSDQLLLLILDNFEHLLDGTIVVNEILRSCPRLALLVTSRQRLNLSGESQFVLGGLDYPESTGVEDALEYTAVQLFTTAARRTQFEFVLTEADMAHVIQICDLVQGVPLGLLLAAAWSELLSPMEIAAEIENGLDFLAADLADLPMRQRSMVAVFDGTWAMMSIDEQALLARLSVFRGGFTRAAAEQVAGANLRVLLFLVNKSLLQRQVETGRFTMHELLREYAAEKRRQLDRGDEVLLAHCRYFAGLVQQEVYRALFFFPIFLPVAYAADRDNFHRAWDYALEQGLAAEASDLGRGIAYLNLAQGRQPVTMLTEARHLLRQFGVPEADRAHLGLHLIELAVLSGQDSYETQEAQVTALLPLVEASGDLQLRFWTYWRLMDISGELGRMEFMKWAGKMVQAAREGEEETLVKIAETYKLWWRVQFGLDDADSLPELQALLTTFEPDFDSSFAVYGILWCLCRLHNQEEHLARMLSYGQRAVNIAKRWQDLQWISEGCNVITRNFLDIGSPREAAVPQLDALDWHLATGQVWQSLGFLMGLNLNFPQLVGGRAPALANLAMLYHHPDLTAYAKYLIGSNRTQWEEEIGAEAFANAWEGGKEMDFETVVSRVRSALAAAGASGSDK